MQEGTDFDLEHSDGGQTAHGSERQHLVHLQQGNSDVWLQLGLLWDGADTEIHPDSAVESLSAWLFDCAAVVVGFVLVAV